LPNQGQAVAVGQAQVEQDQIDRFRLQNGRHRGPRRSQRNPETLMCQVVGKQIPHLFVIIDR
jgi:hypothetical protein